MPLPQHDETFKEFINDVVCPILEASRKINDTATFKEMISQVLNHEMLACSFVQNRVLEVRLDIDETSWFKLRNQTKFQIIQDFAWLAVPASVIEAIEN